MGSTSQQQPEKNQNELPEKEKKRRTPGTHNLEKSALEGSSVNQKPSPQRRGSKGLIGKSLSAICGVDEGKILGGTEARKGRYRSQQISTSTMLIVSGKRWHLRLQQPGARPLRKEEGKIASEKSLVERVGSSRKGVDRPQGWHRQKANLSMRRKESWKKKVKEKRCERQVQSRSKTNYRFQRRGQT